MLRKFSMASTLATGQASAVFPSAFRQHSVNQNPSRVRSALPQATLSSSTSSASVSIAARSDQSAATWQGDSYTRWRQSERNVTAGAKRKNARGGDIMGREAKPKEEEAMDEDLRIGLNETSVEAIRVMLSEDIQLVSAFREKVDAYGEYLVQEKEMEAARFMLVIKGMINHEIIPETELLKGPYKRAYDKIVGIMEDSGWLLAPPGQEGGDMQMADDQYIAQALQQQA